MSGDFFTCWTGSWSSPLESISTYIPLSKGSVVNDFLRGLVVTMGALISQSGGKISVSRDSDPTDNTPMKKVLWRTDSLLSGARPRRCFHAATVGLSMISEVDAVLGRMEP